jgi:hypothetical protein
MPWIRLCFLFAVMIGSIALPAQISSSSPPPPQTARQALIEMFLGNGENDFTKHLPEAARQALIHKGDSQETSIVLRISSIGRQMVAQGEHTETFDSGPILLKSDQNDGHEKFEVMVEHDSLAGEEDEIELSVHDYKDGQPQSLPVVPRLIFSFKQEAEIWRLSELTVAVHVPLTDPDYLQGLRKQQDESNASAAQNRLTIIAMAERSYVERHPERGYACTLETLFASEPGATPGEGGFNYDPGQSKEEWSGYRFAFSGCNGTPASKYRVSAVPIEPDTGTKMFCADESGTLKSLTGRRTSTCFSQGEVVNGATNQSTTSD